MKVNFDPQSDAAYLYLKDSKVVESEEVMPGIVYDFDEEDQVVGIEILGVKGRTPEQLKQLNFSLSVEDRVILSEFFGLLKNALA